MQESIREAALQAGAHAQLGKQTAPAIDAINQTLSETNNVLTECVSLLFQLDGMLVGEQPEAATRGEDAPCRPGKLGTAQDLADTIERTARSMHNHINQLIQKL